MTAAAPTATPMPRAKRSVIGISGSVSCVAKPAPLRSAIVRSAPSAYRRPSRRAATAGRLVATAVLEGRFIVAMLDPLPELVRIVKYLQGVWLRGRPALSGPATAGRGGR